MALNTRCALCREIKALTFEHIPPRRVFNSSPALVHTLDGLSIGSSNKKPPIVREGKGGMGRKSLCAECNGTTAARYGDAFAEWTKQCLEYADRVTSGNNILLPYHIQPLNVLKQIATMILACSAFEESTATLDGLRGFILSPQRMAFPGEVVVSCYLNPLDPTRKNNRLLSQNRLSESCGILDVKTGTTVMVLGEVAFPPMGYVAYTTDGKPVSSDFSSLCDLRGFSRFYLGQRADLYTCMPVRYPFGPVPGYYPNLGKSHATKFLDDGHVLLTKTGQSK